MKVDRDMLTWIQRMRGHGFSQQEIGDMLGVSQQVVAYNLHKLKKEFKKKYSMLFKEDDAE